MFHWTLGTPFDEINQGKYSNKTFWEQLDGGLQFSPTRKFLTTVPFIL